MESLTIVKVGGKIVEEPDTLQAFLASFSHIGGYKLLVHGGGRSATRIAAQLGIESRMVEGRRVTDADTLRVVTMVYGGLVNKNIVAGLQAMQVNALGVTGADLNLLLSDKRPVGAVDYGFVGDVKRVDGQLRVFAKGGRENTGIDALDWLEQGVKNGAGELVVNSIDTDGVKNGFDLELLDAVAARCAVPIIASGGAGKKEDFLELFRNHPAVDAGLAASIFHTKQVEINDLKRYLRENGVEMRV